MDSLTSIGRKTPDSLPNVDNPPIDDDWSQLENLKWSDHLKRKEPSEKEKQEARLRIDAMIAEMEDLIDQLGKYTDDTNKDKPYLEPQPQLQPQTEPISELEHNLSNEQQNEKPKTETISMAEIYRSTQNPLTDELINQAITARVDASKNDHPTPTGPMNDIYLMLTKDKTKTEAEPILEDKAKFHEKLFDTWRKNLEQITPEQYQQMLAEKKVGTDFWDMRNYLLQYPNAKYAAQLRKKAMQEGHKDLSKAISKYCYDYVSDGWDYITSYKLNGCRKPGVNDYHIGHRLYLNIPNDKLYQIANIIVDKFQTKDLPFEFKFADSNKDRKDSLIFYCETEQLPDTIQALQDLKNDQPKLFEQVGEPPIATGKIDGWIGYGSEPEQTGKESFNTIRSLALWKGITDTAVDWVIRNKDVRTRNGDKSIKEMIAEQAIIDRQSHLHTNSTIKNRQKLQQDIMANFDEALEIIRNNSVSIKDGALSNETVGAVYKIKYSDFANTIAGLIPFIKKVNPKFQEQCRQNIIEACSNYGINKQNFAYDDWALKEMVEAYNSNQRK